MSSVTHKRFPSMLFVCTLQVTKAEAERQLCFGTHQPSAIWYHRELILRSDRPTLIPPARSLLLAGIVAAAGSYCEFAVPGSAGLDPDSAISACGFGRGGLVADGVLVANVTGYRAADLVNFIQGAGKECDASSALRNGLQGALGASRPFVTQQTDGVDRGAIFFLQLAHCLLQRFAAGIVFAVGHHEQDFLLQLAMLF